MDSVEEHLCGRIESVVMPTAFRDAHWYAVMTTANHERRVAQNLASRSVEYFLPVYASSRRWKDRRVTLQLPLFPGYVFVKIPLRDKLQVLQVNGVARLVGFDGTPAVVPDGEIDTLRKSLASGTRAGPHPFLKVGQPVRLKSGPLAGTTGILLRAKGKCRLVISINLIRKSVALDVDAADIELAT